MNYTLHQLKVFLKVAEYESITKASEELHLTQPAVSIQLKKLQEQFDIPLIEVIGRQLYVTDFGKKIAAASRKIISETEAIKHTIDHYKGLLSGKIRISVVSTGKYVIPYFLKSFMDAFPGVDINIDVSNKTQVLKGLAENSSDFYLVSVLPEDVAINAVPLMQNHLFLVGKSDHENPVKSIKDLNEVTLIFRESGSATRNAMEYFLKSNEVKVSKKMELVSNEAVKQAVNAGIGFSIMPLIGLRNSIASGSMQIYPLKGLPITTQWNLIYNKGKSLDPAKQEFLKFLEENRESIVESSFSWTRKYV
jgi:DNA-binding transcriptional LysR family regulator